MTVFARVLAAAVGAVVAYAGANKVTDRASWRAAVTAQGLPDAFAHLVPPVELVLGVCLVVLPVNPTVLGLTTLLLLVFTVFLVVQIAGKSTVPCACFGVRTARPPRGVDVIRNLVLMAALCGAAVLA
jgi:uncharacterized membrane protein YphA (DoxX/SURF4 family)